MTSTSASESVDDADSSTTPFGLGAALLEESRWDTERSPFGGIALLTVLVAFWQLGGALGIIAWIVVALSWLVFPPIVPVAIGQFALVAMTAADTGLVGLLPAEATLGALLVADVWSDTGSTAAAVAFTGVAILSGATILVFNSRLELLETIVGLLLLFGAVSYLCYRLLLDLDLLLDDTDKTAVA
ncbi:hypothetical protein ACFQGE_00070 [Halomicroarcula sp. GCM10025817]|uniref:hypothetical protein n=1 Tax=Haloarcula TaxID=2237 RepID=UPI0023E79DB6|nr:hypothetical protein [Halomicroarcula sp. SYNS111]